MQLRFMFGTSSFIKRHVSKLPRGVLFSTRDLLSYGKRNAIDQCLYRLVKAGRIVRLARGIFVRPADNTPLPSAYEVARTKATAFAKEIFTWGADAARQFDFTSEVSTMPIFAIVGRTSSFRYGDVRITLKGTAPRFLKLGDSVSGRVIRAFRHIGQDIDIRGLLPRLGLGGSPSGPRIQPAIRMHREDREELYRAASLMPSWLADALFTKPALNGILLEGRALPKSRPRPWQEVVRDMRSASTKDPEARR